MSKWIYMNINGQGHSLTLVQGHSDSTFSNFFPLETARLNEAKFHVDPPWGGGTKVCSNGPGHMTKMAAMPLYGKNLNKSSSLEPKCQWPWKLVCNIGYSSTLSFFKWWPCVDLYIFYGNVKFGPLCFCIGKRKKNNGFFSETILVYVIEVGRCSQLNEFINLYEYQRSRSFIDLGHQIQHFQTSFP